MSKKSDVVIADVKNIVYSPEYEALSQIIFKLNKT